MQKRHTLHLLIFSLSVFCLFMIMNENPLQQFNAQLDTGVIHGRFGVFNGDTIGIHFKKVRLRGIDAVELNQICLDEHGKEWECGKQARSRLAKLIDRKDVHCNIESEHNKVAIALCRVGDLDLSKAMVRSGYAIAYRRFSHDYVDVENRAREKKRGIWKGTFIEPEKWREEKAKREGKTKPEDQSDVNHPKP